MDLELVREINPQRFKEINSIAPMFFCYSIYAQAQFLGITFSPNEIDIDQLNHFSIMKAKIEEIGNGKRSQNNIRPTNR